MSDWSSVTLTVEIYYEICIRMLNSLSWAYSYSVFGGHLFHVIASTSAFHWHTSQVPNHSHIDTNMRETLEHDCYTPAIFYSIFFNSVPMCWIVNEHTDRHADRQVLVYVSVCVYTGDQMHWIKRSNALDRKGTSRLACTLTRVPVGYIHTITKSPTHIEPLIATTPIKLTQLIQIDLLVLVQFVPYYKKN